MAEQSPRLPAAKLDLAPMREGYTKVQSAPGGAERFFRAFYEVLAADVMIGFFFTGKDLTHIAAQQQAFVERALGLRATYGGKPPATAHLGLPKILPGFFDRRLVLLRDHLARYGLSEREIESWLAFENAFRESIVAS